MADVYEKNLDSKTSLTMNDFIRVVGSDNVSYKQLVSDVADKIITTYAGATLAGSEQSVKDAIDGLDSAKQPKTMSQTIAGETTVEGCLSALQPKTMSQTIGGQTTVEGCLSSLNSKFGGIKLVHLTKTVTVPANSSLELNLTSDIGNHSIMVLSATLGLYQLPYVVNGAVKTWIYRAYNQTIIIQNNESAWDNYTLNLVLAVLP